MTEVGDPFGAPRMSSRADRLFRAGTETGPYTAGVKPPLYGAPNIVLPPYVSYDLRLTTYDLL